MELGHLAAREGHLTRARVLLDEALELRRAIGEPRRIMFILENLAHVAVLQGNFAAARPYLEECWAVASRIRDSWNLPGLLETSARLAAAREDWGRTLR